MAVEEKGGEAVEEAGVGDGGEEVEALVAVPEAPREDTGGLGARGEGEEVGPFADEGVGEGGSAEAEFVSVARPHVAVDGLLRLARSLVCGIKVGASKHIRCGGEDARERGGRGR